MKHLKPLTGAALLAAAESEPTSPEGMSVGGFLADNGLLDQCPRCRYSAWALMGDPSADPQRACAVCDARSAARDLKSDMQHLKDDLITLAREVCRHTSQKSRSCELQVVLNRSGYIHGIEIVPPQIIKTLSG